ncbi:type IV conjugative transfer system lipoprotein TraV [Marinomonas algarum]|uniref:Type IV conjugative transfer system lipoprotein TraV n=1 Tax=Marinomonas algarum TaxID=2883105 RepID=A0A9X1IR06_9GAMM|nr:type IV conjugative transfer system lipoprotein TraV [Marinomonas algarum]MCB5162646.1 type IV conjugative transfer system lipoprotein TraV [Marinomonas algarum]
MFNRNIIVKGSVFHTINFKKLASVSGLLLTLSGCSAFNIGESEYGCTGMPDGVQCMSTGDVYEATNNGQIPRPMKTEDGELVEQETETQVTNEAYENSTVNTYVAPNLPDKPIPIRTPAQVMRIWIAPWEDTNGDLNTTGFIYTEIEPRRWVIGESGESSQGNFVFSPLR